MLKINQTVLLFQANGCRCRLKVKTRRYVQAYFYLSRYFAFYYEKSSSFIFLFLNRKKK